MSSNISILLSSFLSLRKKYQQEQQNKPVQSHFNITQAVSTGYTVFP